MTTHFTPAVLHDGAPLRVERGPDGQNQVVFRIDGQERREAFADFVEAERRHALRLRQAAIDRAVADAGQALRRMGRRLRRRLVVAVGAAWRSAPAGRRASATATPLRTAG